MNQNAVVGSFAVIRRRPGAIEGQLAGFKPTQKLWFFFVLFCFVFSETAW